MSLHSPQVWSIKIFDHLHWGFADVKQDSVVMTILVHQHTLCVFCIVSGLSKCASYAKLDSGFPLFQVQFKQLLCWKSISLYWDNQLIKLFFKQIFDKFSISNCCFPLSCIQYTAYYIKYIQIYKTVNWIYLGFRLLAWQNNLGQCKLWWAIWYTVL